MPEGQQFWWMVRTLARLHRLYATGRIGGRELRRWVASVVAEFYVR